MNEKKLKQLFATACYQTAPVPPEDFAEDVLRAIHNSPPSPSSATASLFDQLDAWFPRIAFAALAVMALGVAADFGLSAFGLPDLGDGVSQISAQWFLIPGGL